MENWFFKGPAGSAASPTGAQGMQWGRGLPPEHLPGFTNGLEAERARKQVAGYAPSTPRIPEDMRCFADYLSMEICRCLTTSILNISQLARQPAHIQVPLSGECFERHRGTGADPGGIGGHPDLPVTLPFVGPGGPFTFLVDYAMDQGQKGVINCIGMDTNPSDSATRGAIELRGRIINNGRIAEAPFDPAHGSVVANPDATWFGFPGTVGDPNDNICIKMQENDIFILEARNSFGGGPIDVSAIVCGHHFTPTLQSDDPVRGWITDQR